MAPFFRHKEFLTMALIFSLFIIAIGLSGRSFYQRQKWDSYAAARDQLNTVITSKVGLITTWFRERESDAEIIQKSPFLAARIQQYLQDPKNPASGKEFQDWLRSIHANYDVSSVFLFDAHGALKLAELPSDKPESRDQALIAKAIRLKEIVFGDLFQEPQTKTIDIDLLIPILDRQKPDAPVVGVLLLQIDPRDFLFPLIQSWPTQSRTAEAALVRQDGNDVVFLSELRFRKDSTLNLRLPLQTKGLPAATAALGYEAVFEGKDYRGAPVLAITRKIPGTPWSMVAKIDIEEIQAPTRERAKFTWIVSGLLIALTALAMGLIWRQREARFYRRQLQVELERQALTEHFSYLTQFANDIILLMDQTWRIIEANDRAVKTYDYPHDELVQLTFMDLQPEETRALIQDRMVQVDQKDGILFESVQHDKSGNRFPVETSARVIEIDNKRFYQCIIRDITERKHAEAALKQNEERLKLALEATEDGLWDWNLATGEIYLSPHWAETIGFIWDEIDNNPESWANRVHPDDLPEVIQAMNDHLSGAATSYQTEFRLQTQDGGWKWILSRGKIVARDDMGKPLRMAGTHKDITDHRLQEDELRLCKKAVEASEDMMIVVDRDFTFRIVNESFLRYNRLTREQVLGRKVSDLVSEESFNGLLQDNLERCLTGTPVQYEDVRQYPQLGSRNLLVSYYPIKGREEKVQEIVVVIRDMTIRRQLDQEREITVQLLHLINSPLSMHDLSRRVMELLKDYSGCEAVGIRLRQGEEFPYLVTSGFSERFVACESDLNARDAAGQLVRDADGNPIFECMCGNIVGKKIKLKYSPFTEHGTFWTNSTSALLAAAPADSSLEIAYRGRCIQAGYESIALIPLQVEGKTIGLIQLNDKRPGVFTLDMINFLERLADNLSISLWQKMTEESHLRLATVVEQAAEAILITSIDNIIQYINPAFERITGYTPDEAIGKDSSILKSGKHDEAIFRAMSETVHRGGVWTGRLTNKKKDGSFYEEEATISPVFDATGKIINFVAISRDISQEISLEEQLRQAQKMEAVGRLAGGVAHDFNNILTAITGYGELLQQSLMDEDIRIQDVEQILKAADRASALTRQLLAFSRKQVMQPRIISLNHVVTELENMLRRLIGEDIELHSVLASDLGNVKADPGQLEQVLVNLVVNARDAMVGGGRLTLETNNVDLDEPYAQQHFTIQPGQYVMVAVSDTGCGMNAEVRSHIFEPFFTTKERGKGTGLGLPTVYGIVKQSGGHIWVYSEPGQGTTFKVYLPRVVEPQDLPISARSDKPLVIGTETILLVEDEEAVRNLTVEILRRNGYTVLSAADGPAAIRVSANYHEPIHLMVADMIMPHMNGRELADYLAGLRPAMKVLYISGYTENAILFKGAAEQTVHFLQKPFTPMTLASKVREILDLTPED